MDQNNVEIIFNLNKDLTYCELILNKPNKINSLTKNMFEKILEIAGGLCENINYINGYIPYEYKKREFKKIPKVIYVSGNGKNFCSGADIKSLFYKLKDKDYNYLSKFSKLAYTSFLTIKYLKPIEIAEWNGSVMGGGVGITFNSPIRICNETTIFSMPECRVGFIPNCGAAYFYTTLLNNNKTLGLYAGLTGRRFKGREVFNTGIGNVFIQSEKIPKIKKDIENLCNTNENVTLNNIFEIIIKNEGEIYDESKFKFEYENLINEIFIPDNIFEIFKRLKNKLERAESDKLSPNEIIFLKDTLKTLENNSPLSLMIYTEYFKSALKYKSVEECFITNENLDIKIECEGDVYEGVRSLLIDKYKNPKFKFKTIYDIKDYEVITKNFIENNIN